MSKVNEILIGHINELLDNEEKLFNERMSICKQCPLYKETKFGPICNPDLYINPTTQETSNLPIHGWVKGCSCRLNAKTRSPKSKCIINKW